MNFIVCKYCWQEVATYKNRMIKHKNKNKERCRGSAGRINLMPDKKEIEDIIKRLGL